MDSSENKNAHFSYFLTQSAVLQHSGWDFECECHLQEVKTLDIC